MFSILFIFFVLFLSAKSENIDFTYEEIDKKYCDGSNYCYKGFISLKATAEDNYIRLTASNTPVGPISFYQLSITEIDDDSEFILNINHESIGHDIRIYFSETNSYIVSLDTSAKFSFIKTKENIRINAYYGYYDFNVDPNDTKINSIEFGYSNFLENIDYSKLYFNIYEKSQENNYINNVRYARYKEIIFYDAHFPYLEQDFGPFKPDYKNPAYIKPVYQNPNDPMEEKVKKLCLTKDDNGISLTNDIEFEQIFCNFEISIPLLATTTHIINSSFDKLSCNFDNHSSENFNIDFITPSTLETIMEKYHVGFLFSLSLPSNNNLLISYKKIDYDTSSDDEINYNVTDIVDIKFSNTNDTKILKTLDFVFEHISGMVKFSPTSGLIDIQHKSNDYDYLYDLTNFEFGVFNVKNNTPVNSIVAIKTDEGVKDISSEKGVYTVEKSNTTESSDKSLQIASLVFIILIFAITAITMALIIVFIKKCMKSNVSLSV